MPAAWVAWKRILSCKQDTHLSVFDPKCAPTASHATPVPSPKSTAILEKCNTGNGVPEVKKRRSTSVCCNDLKNVVHGNTRVVHRGDDDSPLYHHHSSPYQLRVLMKTKETYMLSSPSFNSIRSTQKVAQSKRLPGGCYDCSIETPDLVHAQTPNYSRPSLTSKCQKCGDIIDKLEALEEHHVTHHAVTELKVGDSARSIVEIIFQTSWLRMDIPCATPERIFKVHNGPKTVGKFEEYREMVKAKASKTSRKQSRCLVDGNELLRFYGTTISCRLGKMRTSASPQLSSLSSLCSSSSCGICNILRNGFPTKGQPGIYTSASSGQAHESLLFGKSSNGEVRRAMLVCRVIAGRVKRTRFESSQDGPTSGYDSVSGGCGSYGDMEELLVFNSRAVLPCFVVVYSY